MESNNNLDTTGDLRINPLAELLAEIAQNKFNGSLRLTNAAQKIVIYFDAGEVVFAASNARQHRLFEMLLKEKKLTKEQLVLIPDFTNDLALKEYSVNKGLLAKQEIKEFSLLQIVEVIRTALAWRDGGWTFSPLIRIKGDIRFSVNVPNLLVEYARNLPAEEVTPKFSDSQENFSIKSAFPGNVNLSPQQSFVLSRFEKSPMSAGEVQTISGLPEAETCRILYALWLGGLLVRENWSAAFSKKKATAILSARITLKKDEKPVSDPPKAVKTEDELLTESEPEKSAEAAAPVEKQLSLDEYLDRVEKATNYYEIFALAPDADVADIKQIYFSLARRFHPDLFHKEADAQLLQKIKTAFTHIAQAYDTLKTDSSREVYDFRMRKELAEMKAIQAEETTAEAIDEQKQTAQAAENFERGFAFLMDENFDAAVPFFARAIHFDQRNARYHAYYGKALAADNKQRHKAESELQTAIKLDGKNAVYRLMLAEFFISFNLLKRAEGELNRLLAIHPNNIEAQTLLDSLQKK
jgi:hypothetical protein